MKLNKTFLLKAEDSYTEGSMLIVIESVEKYKELFIEYHKKKCDFMIDSVPEFYNNRDSIDRSTWYDTCEKREELEAKFIQENNVKPYDFELSTGVEYVKEGKGEGFFINNIRILDFSPLLSVGYWTVHKEFYSDLPEGTHYCGDYCA